MMIVNEEIIIINDEPFYKIPNGTSYDYAPIPKEFKPYFEKLQQENARLKDRMNKAVEYIENDKKLKEGFNLFEEGACELLEILKGKSE